MGRKFLDWLKQTKPTDLVSVVLTLASVALALAAFVRANEVSDQQAEAEAPILAPGTPPDERGKQITVPTEYSEVSKRADRLYLDATNRPRFVIPLRNGGSGIALVVGQPVLVADCDGEPARVPDAAVAPPLGSYVIPSGESDQLAFLAPAHPASGTVPGQPRLWYSFDYRKFGKLDVDGNRSGNLLIWYTDGAQRKLRWTCIQYVVAGHGPSGLAEWGVFNQRYGVRSIDPLRTKIN